MAPRCRPVEGTPPPIWRNPPRNRRATSRADDPVSLALVAGEPEEISSSSDEEPYTLSEPGTPVRQRAPHSTQAKSDSDLELVEAPTQAHRPHQPTNTLDLALQDDFTTFHKFMRLVDAPDGTYTTRVNRLIAKIHRLRRTAIVPSTPNTTTIPSEPDVSMADQFPMAPAATLDIVPASTNPVVPDSGRTFVEVLVLAPPDHTLLERLSTRLLGRVLRSIQERAQYYIGTSDIPVDVHQDYMNHMYRFHELGSWADLEMEGNTALLALSPVPASPERNSLLASQELDSPTPTYTVYIYHEDTQTVWSPPSQPAPMFSAPTIESALPHASITNSIPTPVMPPTMPPATATGHTNDAVTYLVSRFTQRLTAIRALSDSSYGSAYRHIMQEKHFMSISNAVGLNLNTRIFAPVTVEGGLSITFDDVVSAAGLNLRTFGGTRTTMGKAREARRRLARYIRDGTPVAEDADLRRIHQVPQVMLHEPDIDEGFLTDTTGTAEAEAITMTYETFKGKLAYVLNMLSS
ncbi:hypothetical protein B0H17DRAFT_1220653 [Mycena rosella]|uniref:Uncharacterized protein n=1 Tax=Mycena rosella TaxID=1033263 RepID=A0AAD7B9I8_MYCRO|nr:hypothetical protein B0H17DRAFT_1220653 [Mycena rosella]